MLPVEVSNEPRIEDVAGGDPGSLLWTITLPVDQVLDAPPTAMRANEPLYRVGWVSSDKVRRRRSRGSRNQGALHNWLDFRDVECGVDSHRPGKLEADCSRVDDLLNFKGTDELGCKFLRVDPER